jgi:hypothetical protein
MPVQALAVHSAHESETGAPPRLLDGGAEQALKLIAESAALEEGKVALVSLVALRSRLGRKWPMRRDLAQEHIERSIARHVGADGFFVRLSETDYLVAQPKTAPLVGQLACLSALRATLDFLLGEAVIADIVVHEVKAITAGAIEGCRIDVAAVEARAGREAGQDANCAAPGDPASTTSLARVSPFVTNDGRRVRVSCTLELLINLKTFGRIGYRIKRRVLQLPDETPLPARDQSLLSRSDVEKIDMATLLRGLDRLGEESGGAKQPVLVLPVSYTSLTNTRSRGLILGVFEQARPRVQAGLLCEICDIEGVPPSALLAATSLIRPFCLFVIGKLNEMPPKSLASLKNTGLQAFSYDWPQTATGEAEFIGEMRSLVAATQPAARTLITYQLTSQRRAAIAAQLGATHATLAANLEAPHAPGRAT